MTDRLKAWAALLVAATGFISAAVTALEADKKQQADFAIVEILAQQLAEAREGCQ